MRVVPVRGWDDHIQGWAVNYQRREYWFVRDRLNALELGNYLARTLVVYR